MTTFFLISMICEAIAIIMSCANRILCCFVPNGNQTAVYTFERITAWLAFVSAAASAVILVGGYILCILLSL